MRDWVLGEVVSSGRSRLALTQLLHVIMNIETNKKTVLVRKPCKFHFINLAVAIAFHPSLLRYVHEFENLSPDIQAVFMEWLVAQEIWRRSVLGGSPNPEAIGI